MKESDQKEHVNKKVTEVETFPVPFSLEKVKENISTITTSKHSKEQLINQAFKFHSQGNISEAAKCYQHFINQGFKDHRVFSNFGVTLIALGKSQEAQTALRKAIELEPDFAEAHSNLGNILRDLGNLKQAEISTRKAIELEPDLADAHLNLGNILRDLGKLEEAELSTRKTLEINPNNANAFSNLGGILIDLGKLEEAELSIRKALEINPNLGEAYFNLGTVLKDLGKLKEAEISTRKAIELNYNSANAYSNLGNILIEIGNLKEAELSIRKALEIEPGSKISHLSLCICLYLLKDKDSALKAIEIALKIDPNSKELLLLLTILNQSNPSKIQNSRIEEIRSNFFKETSDSNLFISKRIVENELIESLYKINSKYARDIKKFSNVIVGNTKSSDFNLFENNISIISKLKEDIINLLRTNLKSDIYIKDSFVTICKSGGGVKSHNHMLNFDKILKIDRRKLSLVYYISVGDQNCDKPGILKLNNPNEEILPHNEMILIFPADRNHSASYSGIKDRIIVGVNFYII